MNRLVFYIAIVVIAVVVVLAGRMYMNMGGQGTGTSTQTATTAQPDIGGPFELVNHNGETVTDKDFHGGYILVYFGYTFCPDVCPTSLTTIGNAMDMLGDDAKKVTPVFISVDPDRDTPEHLREYVSYFHPRLVGLTGTPDQVADAAKQYRVYYAKVVEEGGDPENYLMDHSSITYLMGPDGEFVTHFGHGVEAEVMAERIKKYL